MNISTNVKLVLSVDCPKCSNTMTYTFEDGREELNVDRIWEPFCLDCSTLYKTPIQFSLETDIEAN